MIQSAVSAQPVLQLSRPGNSHMSEEIIWKRIPQPQPFESPSAVQVIIPDIVEQRCPHRALSEYLTRSIHVHNKMGVLSCHLTCSHLKPSNSWVSTLETSAGSISFHLYWLCLHSGLHSLALESVSQSHNHSSCYQLHTLQFSLLTAVIFF